MYGESRCAHGSQGDMNGGKDGQYKVGHEKKSLDEGRDGCFEESRDAGWDDEGHVDELDGEDGCVSADEHFF